MNALAPVFRFDLAPFDTLNAGQRRWLLDRCATLQAADGQTLQPADQPPSRLFVLISGQAHHLQGDELRAEFGPDDCFDGRALLAGRAGQRLVAAGPVSAFWLPGGAVRELAAANPAFGEQLAADLAQKIHALTVRQHELHSLTMARVDQAVLRPAHLVAADTDIVAVVQLFSDRKTTQVLVRADDGGDGVAGLGIFTTSGLQRAILSGRPLDRLPVGELASRPLVTARPSDPLYDALARMIRHRVQRLVVVDESPDGVPRVAGLLEQIDLLSLLSNHSYLITRQIIDADGLDALQQAAAQIGKVIGLLHAGGTRVHLIARLVQALNAQLFERAWQLLAPPELVANSCLFVMGSEGRGEQLLKTDQDNGLLLRDGYTPPAELAAICERFSQALARFGYPECPGHIMLSNPQWRHGAAEFGAMARRWLLMPTPEGLMSLAIFLDAHAVAGDAALLQQLRSGLSSLVADNDALLARFAAAVDAFDSGGGWWTRLLARDDQGPLLDLKKAATFPLVHGVRSLALAHGVAATSTAARIEALVSVGALEPALAADLVDSLHFFMGLKLKLGLAAIAAGQLPGGPVVLDRLGSLDRDLLKDTLAVVRRFKALLTRRFHLDAL